MNTNILCKLRKYFNSPDVPRSTNRHNQRAWVRSVRHLGDKWLLAKHVKLCKPV
jgi:hypothetical protein